MSNTKQKVVFCSTCFISLIIFGLAEILTRLAHVTDHIRQVSCELTVELTNGTCSASNITDADYACYTVLREITFEYVQPVFCTLVVNETLYDTGSEDTSQLRALDDYEDSRPTTTTCYQEVHKCLLHNEDAYIEDTRRVYEQTMVLIYWTIGLAWALAILMCIVAGTPRTSVIV